MARRDVTEKALTCHGSIRFGHTLPTKHEGPARPRDEAGRPVRVGSACYFLKKMRVWRGGIVTVGPFAVVPVTSSSSAPPGRPLTVLSASERLMAT